jgi:hypothetical protein
MVYNYKRKTATKNNKAVIEECLEYMKHHEISVNAAAKQFKLSEATLRRHAKAKSLGQPVEKCGHLSSLPISIEGELAMVARTAARHGFPFSKKDLAMLIGSYVRDNKSNDDVSGQYLRRNCMFANDVPSDDWVTHFMRNHHLSLHTPSSLERRRQEAAMDPFIIYDFYDNLEKIVDDLDIRNMPSAIYNLDESSFSLDPSRGKRIGEKGKETKRTIAGSGRSNFTALICVCADGTALPPLFIFEAKHLYQQWKGDKALPGTTYACSGR